MDIGGLVVALGGSPWLLAIVVGAWVTRYILVTAAENNEALARWLGPLGRRRRQNVIIEDLQGQVDYLVKRVDALLGSSLCVEAYLVYDAEWHRTSVLKAALTGTAIEPHKDYETFKAEWESLRK